MTSRRIALLLAAGLVAGVTVAISVASPPAHAAARGAAGWQVITSRRDGVVFSAWETSISADGHLIAFASPRQAVMDSASNGRDIFVQDPDTWDIERVSLAVNGGDPNGDSAYPVLSGNGRYVAFYSDASNLVAGDTNGTWDVFVRDRQLGITARATVDSSEQESHPVGAQPTYPPALSRNGAWIAFGSDAPGLVAADTNAARDVFARDLTHGDTYRLSVANDATEANAASEGAISIDADGSTVAFQSDATNLDAAPGSSGIFLADTAAHSLTQIYRGVAYSPGIRADGQEVVFGVVGSNHHYQVCRSGESGFACIDGSPAGKTALVADDGTALVGGGSEGVYWFADGTTEPIGYVTTVPRDWGPSNVLGNGGGTASISADGRRMTFGGGAAAVNVRGEGPIAGSLAAGGSLDTDAESDGATHLDPIEVAVRTPNPGSVSISEEDYTPDYVEGEDRVLALRATVDAPAASVQSPLSIGLTLDPALFGAYQTLGGVQLLGATRSMSPCKEVGVAGPDPCVGPAAQVGDDVRITVYSTKGGTFLPTAIYHPPAYLQEVSSSSDGAHVATTSDVEARISDDGRYVVFESSSRLVVPGDASPTMHVFVKDRRTGGTEIVDVSSSGQGDAAAHGLAISSDGSKVLFSSRASNLSTEAPPGINLYVRDRGSGSTELVSIGLGGQPLESDRFYNVYQPTMSRNARYVYFDYLPPGAAQPQRLVRDLSQATTQTLQSFVNDPQAVEMYAWSRTGRYVYYGPGNLGGSADGAHLWDAGSETTVPIWDGGLYSRASISDDGRLIATSAFGATILVVTATNSVEVVRDFKSIPQLSADGRYLFYCVELNEGGPAGMHLLDLQTRTEEEIEPLRPDAIGYMTRDATSILYTDFVFGGGSGYAAFVHQRPLIHTSHVGANGSVTLGGDGGIATPTDPVVLTLTSPTAGDVLTKTGFIGGAPAGGYGFVGRETHIEAPTGTVGSPLLLDLRYDASLFDEGQNPLTLEVFRDEMPIADCSALGATPDPCVASRGSRPDGDVAIDIRSTHASSWNLGLADSTPPKVQMASPVARFQVGRIVPVSLAARDALSGVGTYSLRYRTAGTTSSWGPYRSLALGASSGISSVHGTPGSTYCFTGKATDLAGNATPSWTLARCSAVPLNDTSLARIGAWTETTDPASYLGDVAVTKAQGASLKATVTAKRIAILATRCKACGTVVVLWNGDPIKTISLTAATTIKRQVISVAAWSSIKSGTITLKVLTSGKSILIEGLGVSRD